MRNGTLFFWITVALFFSLAPAPVRAQTPELIPREVLFGNPVKSTPRLSPDGRRLAYLAPSEKGVMNIWVRTLGKENDIQVTRDSKRGIRTYFWAEDNKHLLYIQDLAGDENYHVYSTDPESLVTRDLTPFLGIRAQNILTDKHHPDEILVGLNLKDRRIFDMFRIRLTTGAVIPDTENPGDVVGWVTDPNFVIRAAIASQVNDGSTVLRVRDSAGGPWRTLGTWPFGEDVSVIDFSQDGASLLLETSIGSDTSRLARMDAATGKELGTLAADSRCDLGEVMIHPDTRKVEAVSFSYLKPEWKVLDSGMKADFEALSKVHPGFFSITGRDHSDKIWTVAYRVDNGPVASYVYRRGEKKADLLFLNQPALQKYKLAPMTPLVIPARDGLKLVSYLTVPHGVEPKHLPTVLLVHGGPWVRDHWGMDSAVQWLANRGYAVLQVNFRGSTGFGKKFINSANGQWGIGSMQHDLTDAVQWAIKNGIADPRRVAIFGGSYGGYATLAGLTFTPELYACGVDLVGPSNLRTLLQSIPPYWALEKHNFTLRIGNVEEDDELNRKLSPLFHVDKIRAPLLIGQGANDPRVNIRESDQIVHAMRARNLPVIYAVCPDEGHGFMRPENRLDFFGRAEEFLAKYLGGRAEPWKEIKGSGLELR